MPETARRPPPLRTPESRILVLRAGVLWKFFREQDLAFWAMCFYLIVEYIRPQQLSSLVNGWPLGIIALGLAAVGYMGSWLLLLFTAILIASSITAYDPSVSFAGIRVWYSWVAIYFLIINVVNTRQRFAFFILLWLMCHYYMSQGGAKQFAGRGFSFAPWGIIGAPGWFANSGEFGIAMCMMVAVSWHYYAASAPYLTKMRKIFVLGMPVTAALGVIGSSSRGAVIGLGAIGALILLRSKIQPRSFIAVALIAMAAWFVLPPEQKARFTSAGDDGTSVSRKVYWLNGLDIARTHPLLGIGYENWLKFYAAYYVDSEVSRRYEVSTVQVVHNIFIQCMAELGYTGLLVFVLLIIATGVINAQTRRLVRTGADPPDSFVLHMSYALDEAMWSYLAAGFFVTVLYYPFFWINLALTVSLNAIVRTPRGRLRRSFIQPPSRVRAAATPMRVAMTRSGPA
jgi:putative inorganic carbon (HCO3(-)) transporter